MTFEITFGSNIKSNTFLFNPNKGGGALGPPPAGIRTPFLNNQRYWAVLWWLLISKPFQSTGELRFEIYYYNFQKFLVENYWSASILKKKIQKKFFFLQFFLQKSYFFFFNVLMGAWEGAELQSSVEYIC